MAPIRSPRMRPGLRTVFVLLGLLVLFIAFSDLVLFRLYDNQLTRRTEAELIAQGTSLASTYRQAVLAELAQTPSRESGHGTDSAYGNPIAPAFQALHAPDLALRPWPANLSLGTDAIRPPAEPPRSPEVPPDETALAAGSALGSILHETTQTTLAGIRIVDFRGTVVASSHRELDQSLAQREEIRRALQGDVVSLFRRRISDEPPPSFGSLSRETGVRVFVALPVVAADRVVGAVVLSRTPMTLGKAFYQDRFSLLSIAGILVAAVLAVSLLAATLINLADNARKHGGPHPTLRIAASRVASPPQVVIEVSDDGPGISEANRARVFDPFFTTARDRGGTGMGLTIARALLQSHGGSIEIVPSSSGACFRLTIPG